MDNKKILIANLSKGRVGEDASRLLGALLITKLQLAAMSRVDTPEKEREDFYLYVDEFQNFATESFASILSEARKYRLNLVLAHQYITQMEEKVRDAVFGNVGTLILFRVGAEDAEFLEKEFSPEFMATDIVNLEKFTIYLKLMVDGIATRPFWARTLYPFAVPEDSDPEAVLAVSRGKYSVPREKVESAIVEWAKPIEGPKEDRRSSTDRRPRDDRRPSQDRRPPIDRKPFKPRETPFRKPDQKPMELSEALKKGPIDFKGKPAPTKRPEVKTGELKDVLEKDQRDK